MGEDYTVETWFVPNLHNSLKMLSMEFLSTIGFIAVAVAIIYFVIQAQSYTDNEYNKVSHLIKYCNECEQYRDETSRQAPSKYVKKEIVRIFLNPNIKAEAVARKKEAEAYELEQSQRYENELKEHRKIGNEYAEAIFSIFDEQRKLTFDVLTDNIRNYYQFQDDKDIWKIFMIWKHNALIEVFHDGNTSNYFERVDLQEQEWQISYILTHSRYKLAPSDTIWSEWLQKHGKTLK